MKKSYKLTGGADSLAFTQLPCQAEHAPCHPEFISGSSKRGILVSKLHPQQQIPKPSARTQLRRARKLANGQVQVRNDSVCGFTLAEVLITLAIIGVVAALTIPTVVRNYQKQQTVVKLKKVYSALANTTNLAIADHGPVLTWNLEHGKSKEFADKYLIPYLKVSKNCGYTTSADCAFKYTYLNSNTVQQDTASTRFYLNDGTLIALSAYDYSTEYKFAYANVYVDINGQKKPNKFGKDIFHFIYWTGYELAPKVNGKFIAYGMTWTRNELINDPAAYTCRKDKDGRLCAALIMHDGWQIKDDYPW